jgi:hypothetical protein
LIDSEDKKLMEKFEASTGKNAIWRGKITKGYLEWKKKQTGKKKKQLTTTQTYKDSTIVEIRKIYSMLENLDHRVRKLEKESSKSEKIEISGTISEKHFFRILKTAYNSSEKKFGDFVSVSALTNKIKEFIPWSTQKIHSELYNLFMNYQIDLQPGKKVEGVPLVQDGKTFVWVKLK